LLGSGALGFVFLAALLAGIAGASFVGLAGHGLEVPDPVGLIRHPWK